MAPTTRLGMKATTAPFGRDPKQHGYPMHMCEILNQLTAPYYLERCSCNTPANVIKTRKAIVKAFRNQLEGKGFSLIEIVTSCPTNWGMDPVDALKFLEEKMFLEFPLGVVRDRSKEEK
jgi:2-oxoglutarate ferredoxin oxidoreductase subunit beta